MRVLSLWLLAASACHSGTFIISSSKGSGGMSASTTIYGGIWSGGTGLTASLATTENNVQMVMGYAGTFSKMRIHVVTNDRGASSLTFRKATGGWNTAASDGSEVISINSSQTGDIDEATNGGSYHTDHVNAGDAINVKLISGSGGTTSAYTWYSILFTPDNTSLTLSKFGGYTSTAFTSGATYYQGIGANAQNNSALAESATQFKFRTGGTWKNLCVTVTANTFTTNSTLKSRVGGSNGAQTMTIPASTTGQFCDAGSGDTVSDGSLGNLALTIGNGSGSGSVTVSSYSSEFVTTDNTAMLMVQYTGNSNTIITSSTKYSAPNGDYQVSPQGSYAVDLGCTMTISNMSVNIRVNSLTSSTTIGLWKANSTTLNLTLAFGSGITGYLDDNTHSDSIVAGDTVELKTTTGATGTSIQFGALAIKATVPATPSTGMIRHRITGGLD